MTEIDVVVSCPEWGSLKLDGSGPYDQEVTTMLTKLQEEGRIRIAFDRAGTSNASKEDTDAFAAAITLQKAGTGGGSWMTPIKGTKWFQTYKGGVKKALTMIQQERPGALLIVLCINGGPITQVEQLEMAAILSDAKTDAAKSGVSLLTELRTMSYHAFLKSYDSEWHWTDTVPTKLQPVLQGVKGFLDEQGFESLDDFPDGLDEELKPQMDAAVEAFLEGLPALKKNKNLNVWAELNVALERFRVWDKDGGGTIDYMEMDAAINANFSREMIGLLLGKDNLQDKFEEIDANGDGQLSFSEVYAQCVKDPKFFGLLKNNALTPVLDSGYLAMQAKYPELKECAALVKLGLTAADTVR
eukprot:COSAG05_NODE_101_length_19100_cov_24.260144_8_plen_357_part_00